MDIATILHAIADNLKNNKYLGNPVLQIGQTYTFHVDFTAFQNMLEISPIGLIPDDNKEDLK